MRWRTSVFKLGTILVSLAMNILCHAHTFTEIWSVQETFNMPESARYHPRTDQIFVSNVNHYAKDSNGFVSMVSVSTQELDLRWLTGLNSPTGITASEELLYVVDFDELLIIDIDSKRILQRIASPDEAPALNDVALSPSGRVFVSGSTSKTIYELKNNTLQVWKQDDSVLRHANGLLAMDDQLVHGGSSWTVFDLKDKSAMVDALKPDQRLQEFDGITSDGCGGYLTTMIDDARIWHISANGGTHPLSEQKIDGIDLHKYQDRLFVPRVGGGLSLYQVDSKICH